MTPVCIIRQGNQFPPPLPQTPSPIWEMHTFHCHMMLRQGQWKLESCPPEETIQNVYSHVDAILRITWWDLKYVLCMFDYDLQLALSRLISLGNSYSFELLLIWLGRRGWQAPDMRLRVEFVDYKNVCSLPVSRSFALSPERPSGSLVFFPLLATCQQPALGSSPLAGHRMRPSQPKNFFPLHLGSHSSSVRPPRKEEDTGINWAHPQLKLVGNTGVPGTPICATLRRAQKGDSNSRSHLTRLMWGARSYFLFFLVFFFFLFPFIFFPPTSSCRLLASTARPRDPIRRTFSQLSHSETISECNILRIKSVQIGSENGVKGLISSWASSPSL